MNIYILQGLPGSGKSTWAETRKASMMMSPNNHPVFVISADHYFVNRVTGAYEFRMENLSQAHGLCFRKFISAVYEGLQEREASIIVDNTNTTVLEVAPYMAAALAYRRNGVVSDSVHLIRFVCSPVDSLNRNIHRVPMEAIRRMDDNLMKFDREAPPWWPRAECY
jgi:predicted kinase